LVVSAVAFGAPLLLGLFPRVRLPAPVLEIVAGIVLGPSVLGWVEVDPPIAVLALIGLAFLLFLAGLEIDYHWLRGLARLAAAEIGLALDELKESTAAVMIAAGLLSVVLSPLLATTILRRPEPAAAA
jgi:Kef-type K+ transport system membrane component KefB